MAMLALGALALVASACSSSTTQYGRVTYTGQVYANSAPMAHIYVNLQYTGSLLTGMANCSGNDRCFDNWIAGVGGSNGGPGPFANPPYWNALIDCGPADYPAFCAGSNQAGDNPSQLGTRDPDMYLDSLVGRSYCIKIAFTGSAGDLVNAALGNPVNLADAGYAFADHLGDGSDAGWNLDNSGNCLASGH
jgi:hypothetical protein